MYYLQSRYYNPEWGRFVNGDGIVGSIGKPLTHNIFSYCINNPINMFDNKGTWPEISIKSPEMCAGPINGATAESSESSGSSDTPIKPLQWHHFLTNKSKIFTKQFEAIIGKYSLKLTEPWNLARLPHLGRHPNAYHDYMLQSLKVIDFKANGDPEQFKELFEGVKKIIIENSGMLTKFYWKK